MIDFNKYNNLFRTQQTYDDVRAYLQSNKTVVPQHIRYKTRFKNDFDIFEINGNNQIYYRGDYNDIIVVPPNQKENTLDTMYFNKNISLGLGQDKFYQSIKDRYIGITEKDVKEFLHRQTPFQLSRPIKKPINKPIVPHSKNVHWQVDHVIMLSEYRNQNNGYQDILVVIDLFTKYLWIRPQRTLSAQDTIQALDSIIQEAGATPRILQTDNFTSFSGGDFETYLRQRRIRHVFSKTYSPQSNGTVENANGQIRKKLRDLFLRQNNFRWYDQLHYIQESWNTTRHGTTKQRPVDLYFDHGNDELQDEVYQKLRDRAENLLTKYRAKQFQEGDWVRVSMVALDSQVRRAHKEGKIKNVVALWSKTKYKINHIVRNRLANWQYSIKDRFGRPVIAHREPALFFASELLATNPYDPLFDNNPNLAINVAQLNRFANSNVNPNQQLPAPNQIPLHTRAGVINQGPIALRTRGRGGGPLLRLRGGAHENDSEEED